MTNQFLMKMDQKEDYLNKIIGNQKPFKDNPKLGHIFKDESGIAGTPLEFKKPYKMDNSNFARPLIPHRSPRNFNTTEIIEAKEHDLKLLPEAYPLNIDSTSTHLILIILLLTSLLMTPVMKIDDPKIKVASKAVLIKKG